MHILILLKFGEDIALIEKLSNFKFQVDISNSDQMARAQS
jgi:hypothetical protein